VTSGFGKQHHYPIRAMVKVSNDVMLYNGVLFIIPCGDSIPKVFIYSFYEFKEYMLSQIYSRMCV
jgi:hypothetical protein